MGVISVKNVNVIAASVFSMRGGMPSRCVRPVSIRTFHIVQKFQTIVIDVVQDRVVSTNYRHRRDERELPEELNKR
jgi:hypothetical protein